MPMSHVRTPDVGLTCGVHGSCAASGMRGWGSLGRWCGFGASPAGLGRRRLCPPARWAPLGPGVCHLPPCRAQSQPFARSWPGLEQDSALSSHPGISLLGILRDPPMRHPIPCYEPAPWMGGDGESPAAWDGTQSAPATHPRERGLVTSMSPCPWRSTLSPRSKCHPGPAAAAAFPLPPAQQKKTQQKPPSLCNATPPLCFSRGLLAFPAQSPQRGWIHVCAPIATHIYTRRGPKQLCSFA